MAREGDRFRTPAATEVYDRVADVARIDRDHARRATEAAMEALGDRISLGDADDLATFLPPDLGRALARGEAKSSGAARPLSLDEFLAEIADLEGTDIQDAREHAPVVFAVLRHLIGDEPFRDVFEQVPDDYAVILGPRP